MKYLILMLCLGMISGLTTTLSGHAQETSITNRIAVRVVDGEGEFYDTVTGETFVPRGVNFIDWKQVGRGYCDYPFHVGLYDAEHVRTHFRALAERGYNTARIFFDHCNTGSQCINNPDGRGLNPTYIDNIGETMQIAGEEGIYLLLTSNDLPDEGGYWDISSQGANETFEDYRNAHYLTEPGVRSAQIYWQDLMEAFTERDAPTEALLGWSLLNEQWYFKKQPPLSLNSGTATTANGQTYELSDPEQKRAMLVEGIAYYINEVSAVIREYDPDTLITTGFFAPQFPNPTETGGDWYVDTALLFDLTTLDFYDFHAYPGGDIDIVSVAENFGLLDHPEYPVIMGEVGAFEHIYASSDLAAIALNEWITTSCTVGFDGWLFWDYFGAPSIIGDSAWGMVEDDNFMLDVFAPVNQPDACQLIDLPTHNLAFRRPATASRSLPEEPTSNLTDGSDAQWGAGEHPPHWVMIDLEEPRTIDEITLQVAQYPAGETTHQVWAQLGDGRYVLLETLTENTSDNEILPVTLERTLSDVQAIRVDTLESPSWVAWKEISVFGGDADDGACVVWATANINLREQPTTNSAAVGQIPAGRGAYIDRQTMGEDGLVWWHLLGEVWVRSDVVETSGECDTLPAIN